MTSPAATQSTLSASLSLSRRNHIGDKPPTAYHAARSSPTESLKTKKRRFPMTDLLNGLKVPLNRRSFVKKGMIAAGAATIGAGPNYLPHSILQGRFRLT